MMYEAAVIIDNRDGSQETLTGSAENVNDARANAFFHASVECRQRNKHEDGERFVALSWRACERIKDNPCCQAAVAALPAGWSR